MGRKWGKRANLLDPRDEREQRADRYLRAVSEAPILALHNAGMGAKIIGVSAAMGGESGGLPASTSIVIQHANTMVGLRLNRFEAQTLCDEIADTLTPPPRPAAG